MGLHACARRHSELLRSPAVRHNLSPEHLHPADCPFDRLAAVSTKLLDLSRRSNSASRRRRDSRSPCGCANAGRRRRRARSGREPAFIPRGADCCIAPAVHKSMCLDADAASAALPLREAKQQRPPVWDVLAQTLHDRALSKRTAAAAAHRSDSGRTRRRAAAAAQRQASAMAPADDCSCPCRSTEVATALATSPRLRSLAAPRDGRVARAQRTTSYD